MTPRWLLCGPLLLLPIASSAMAAPAERAPRSCAQELGRQPAQALADTCRALSPATHPPCNAANSCALVQDEIARSCALFGDGEAAKQPGCGPRPSSAEAAAAVVQRYYRALDARDYGTAWQQWGDDGQPGNSYERFRQGYAKTRSVGVTLGQLGPVEGAAGSLYVSVPVTVNAQLSDGRRQTFTGTYQVRRVNDVDGASAEQRRWHLDSAKLSLKR
ncbi:hypothetical protein [Pseudomonas sp. EpS/L25]|uniref:hypothetical protein n=1 Tax=Pseudomonas sp. EpS/L25 TaxID=1749078 RepID=UPI0007444509|nr:hypothetical protein [Pseudomonas sp. EpS/L25]KUM41348.1 hypothetical protein AR540_07435 [Pseudomonas sp. EpS/L25]